MKRYLPICAHRIVKHYAKGVVCQGCGCAFTRIAPDGRVVSQPVRSPKPVQ